ncbi:MAG: M23 family metallopeptidase [Lachnospiraceae bacterium]|nr:M23 family metallopeptidase [Lachnospiraceae bacterium]
MRNKKITAVFNRKSYITAAVIMVVAAFGMTGVYYAQQEKKQEEQLAKEREKQVQQAKAEDAAKERAAEREAKAREAEEKAKAREKEKEEAEAVSGIIEPRENNFMDEPEVVAAQVSRETLPEIHFDSETGLNWPTEQGNVILNYSMDRTIYFATLEQYKYNPAVIIQAEVNTPVKAAASGKVTSIETNEETGVTLTVDLGDGYTARYGQLKEISKNQGDYLEIGEVIGYVSEPTKYYSVEGANLYFQLLKDGNPVDPMEYFE